MQLRVDINIAIKALLFMAMFMVFGNVCAQDDDHNDTTSKAHRPRIHPLQAGVQDLTVGFENFQGLDTSMPFLHRYNKVQSSILPWADLGVTGSPHTALFLDPFSQRSGIQSGFNPFLLHSRFSDNFEFYQAKVPFSRFYYTQGGQGLTMFEALFTRNFSPTWNITLDFKGTQNKEIYSGAGNDQMHKSTRVGSNFVNKKGNFYQTIVFTWNRARRSENGGLSNDTFFYGLNDSTKVRTPGTYFLPILNQAKSYYATREHFIENRFKPNKNKNIYLFQSYKNRKESYRYIDDNIDIAFYGSDIYKDSFSIYDSTAWAVQEHQLGFGTKQFFVDSSHHPQRINKGWYARSFLRYNHLLQYSGQATTTYSMADLWSLGGLAGVHHDSGLFRSLDAEFNYYFNGYLAGNYQISLKSKWKWNKFNIFTNVTSETRAQTLYNQTFTSNNYKWGLSANSNIFNVDFQLNRKWKYFNWNLKYRFFNITNYSWFSAPNKIELLDNLTQSTVENNILLKLKRWHIISSSIFQFNNAEEIGLPKWYQLTGLYYEGPILNKSVYSRIGLDVYYTSKYLARSYQPMNGQFYVNSLSWNGDYPIADFYISGEIKTLTIFIKLEHLNQRYINYGFSNRYESTLYYPTEPFRFRLGLIWKFFN